MVAGLHPVFLAAIGLIIAKWLAELWLDTINRRHVLAHAAKVPPAFENIIDAPTYDQSVRYTLAKNSLSRIEATYDTIILLLIIDSSILPLLLQRWTDSVGDSAWALAGFLFAVGVVLSLTGLPLAWYSQFRVEGRFGFNTSTPKIWWMDRLKGLLLALALGYPLLVLILKLIEWTGQLWWFWAWVCVMAFQLLMVVLAPVLILPLFNKFTPLPEGSLRERLLALGQKTAFPARNIQVMDGSKRSRHSNAFFTGFGRFRKIVLFDTLLAQLSETELEAVLAHEIGHYKKRHIAKMLAWSAAFSLAGFYILAWLARQEWFYRAFGFQPGTFAAGLLLFALLAGTVTFWLSPLANYWSRRHEYQADAYAAKATGEVTSLTAALRKLNEKNLSNLTPHPVFSGFYYSHPTLLERETALARLNLERAESRLVGTT
jgi:STE24 endopeptidase